MIFAVFAMARDLFTIVDVLTSQQGHAIAMGTPWMSRESAEEGVHPTSMATAYATPMNCGVVLTAYPAALNFLQQKKMEVASTLMPLGFVGAIAFPTTMQMASVIPKMPCIAGMAPYGTMT